MYSFEKIKELLLKCIENGIEAELSFNLNNKTYMIIIYKDYCSFQRCGTLEEQSGEYKYKTLDELYKTKTVDDIILERDWNKITNFECFEFNLLNIW